MKEAWTIRREEKDDLKRLRVFYRECFGRELDEKRRNWFHHEAPTGPVRSYIAEELGTQRILATYGLLPILLRHNEREIPASLAVGAAVHPDFRRRGLFVQMGRTVLNEEHREKTSITLGKPNKSALPGHRKVGWNVFSPLAKLYKKSPERRDHRCLELETFDERFDVFSQRISKRFSFLILKDARFMNWRLRAPGQNYVRFVFERNGTLAGYAVIKRYEGPKGRVTHILDLHADDESALTELVSAAESSACGTSEINLWTNPCDPYADRLRRLGFLQRKEGDLLIAHGNPEAEIRPQPGACWFSYLDNDIH
jgi:hypothetical protein